MTSKWNDKTCPLCKAGVFHAGTKTMTQVYKVDDMQERFGLTF